MSRIKDSRPLLPTGPVFRQFHAHGDPVRRRLSRAGRILVPVTVMLAMALGFAACDGPSDARPDTIDVPPRLEVSTADDPQAVRRSPGLIGVLPGDFPDDLPIYLPASLTDFGTVEGRRSVTLFSPHATSRVRRGFEALLGDRGWTATDEGAGRLLLRKGSRHAWLRLENAKPGTVFELQWVP